MGHFSDKIIKIFKVDANDNEHKIQNKKYTIAGVDEWYVFDYSKVNVHLHK
jgi:hypothetical protein